MKVLGEQIGVPVYSEEGNKNPVEIAKNGIAFAKQFNHNLVIIDTAGRLAIDEEMMKEIEAIKKAINPNEILFVVSAATDWLDGYLARKLNQVSSFGAFLDPVADKVLVCACVLVLVHLGRADVFVALIIIGREIAISALREWMAQIGASNSVADNPAAEP